jgi:cyclase
MRRAMLLGMLLVVGAVSMAVSLSGQTKKITIEHVRGNLYYIGNSDPGHSETFTGGSTSVFVTDAGVVVVDTKNAGYGRSIIDQIKTVTDKPVIMLINTHTHFDHTGSNTEFPATVEVVAHENTKANLSKTTCTPVTNCQSFKGENAKYLPKRTFKDRLSLFEGKDRIELRYFGRGHTNGDAWIVFPAVRAVHADFFARKTLPFLDPDNGGSGVEFAPTLDKAVAGLQDVDTFIPGHNPPLPIAALKEFSEYYRDFLTTVQGRIKAGQSPDEIASAYKIPSKYKDYVYDAQRTGDDVRIIYEEMTTETARTPLAPVRR